MPGDADVLALFFEPEALALLKSMSNRYYFWSLISEVQP